MFVVFTLMSAVAASAQTKKAPNLGAVAKATQDAKTKGSESGESSPASADGKTSKPATKTYTNKDLGDEASTPTTAPASSSVASSSTPSVSSGSGDAKDESYWRGRTAPLKQSIRDNSEKAASMRARIASLTDDLSGIGALNARRAGVETERQRLITQLEDLEDTIRRDERALKAVEEEGRRAGALPGWFR